MHWIVNDIRKRAKQQPKKIAFPDAADARVKEAVGILEKENIAIPVLLTPENMDAGKKEEFADVYYKLKPHKYNSRDDVIKVMDDPLYYGAMMTRLGYVDGFVTGATYSTSAVARAAIYCLETDETMDLVSSCFIMAIPNCSYGERGVFIYADCGIIPYPNPEQLASIGISSAFFTRVVLNFEPRVAFLSFSTKGSARGRWVDKVREATEIAKSKAPDLLIDGELQSDAAVDADVATIKLLYSPVAGKANVLIFPNLDAGNISYKLTQRLAKARALGPIMLGFKQYCSDLSRGCSVDDIVDCAAVIGLYSQLKKEIST